MAFQLEQFHGDGFFSKIMNQCSANLNELFRLMTYVVTNKLIEVKFYNVAILKQLIRSFSSRTNLTFIVYLFKVTYRILGLSDNAFGFNRLETAQKANIIKWPPCLNGSIYQVIIIPSQYSYCSLLPSLTSFLLHT